MGEQGLRLKQGQKGAWISIIAYIILSIIKVSIGIWAASEALVADGLNNTTDIISSIAILVGLRIAIRPADRDHRYGHYKAETVAAIIAASIMALVGLDVIWGAFRSLWDEGKIAPHPLAGWVAIASSIVMYFVYRYNKQLARKVKSQAIMAAAYDNRSDALVSLGAAVGIFSSTFGWFWLDSLTALIVGILIVHTAWSIGYHASFSLTDGFDEARLKRIKDKIKSIEGVRTVVDVKGRYHGSSVYVDATIEVDHELTVMESHELTENIEDALIGFDDIEYVHVHVEPYLLPNGKTEMG
ncbi:cation diffusion facilitator family transporter [Microaerobacter geothermalis]|uniref:cation diffusion facilitator family transporter n=1 Tax=Microaerobacter geothermalis TaxID=674972 RepID=UPI001F45B648|nr:cation diffusion facilitator family transporter [Microaerobacter geothermalis]MCF6092592.1 cation diffusion facilitator family transporter [Microaerobacter geothermalis]